MLVNEVEYLTGDFRITDVGISYLADNVIFLRYLEVGGELRKAIGVLKKRLSDFERALRLIEITRYGIQVGEPLTGLRGILRGTPEPVQSPAPALGGPAGLLAAVHGAQGIPGVGIPGANVMNGTGTATAREVGAP